MDEDILLAILVVISIAMLVIASACVVDTVSNVEHDSSEEISDDGEVDTHVIVPVPIGNGNSMYVYI